MTIILWNSSKSTTEIWLKLKLLLIDISKSIQLKLKIVRLVQLIIIVDKIRIMAIIIAVVSLDMLIILTTEISIKIKGNKLWPAMKMWILWTLRPAIIEKIKSMGLMSYSDINWYRSQSILPYHWLRPSTQITLNSSVIHTLTLNLPPFPAPILLILIKICYFHFQHRSCTTVWK